MSDAVQIPTRLSRALAFAVLLCFAPGGERAALGAQPAIWAPRPGHVQVQIWPGPPPDQPSTPGPETATPGAVTNVTRPTMTLYAPEGKNTGAAVVVMPGGGFQMLAMDLEGAEICDWLTSKGVACILLKYRVPSPPYDWRCNCRPNNLVTPIPALEDAQRALRLVRLHAPSWRIDPHKVGVIGFSAGGFLVVRRPYPCARAQAGRLEDKAPGLDEDD